MDNLNTELSNEAQNQPSCLGVVMCRFFIPKPVKYIILWLITSSIGAYLFKILNQIL